MHTENYQIKEAYVLYDGNVEQTGDVTYIPIYMASQFTNGRD
jgi:hypothetical protein